jgi:pilus assembly protein CpaB
MKDQFGNTGSYSNAGGGYTGSFRNAAGGGRPPARKSSGSKNILFLLVALLISGGAGFFVLSALNSANNRPEEETVSIVVAAKDILLGTTLKEEHLGLIQWPKASAPKDYEKKFFSQKERLIGRVAKVDLFEGESILDSRLAPVEAGQGLNALIPSGKRAVAIKVSQESGVAGFIKPGDFVDVLVLFQSFDGLSSQTLLQNIKVLAIGDQYQQNTENAGKAIDVPVVTLLVTPEQGQQLALGNSNGKITLTLRNGYDLDQVEVAKFVPGEKSNNNTATPAVTPTAPAVGKTPVKKTPTPNPTPTPTPTSTEPTPVPVQVIRPNK